MESLSSQQARAGIAAGPSRFSPNQPIPRPTQPRLSVKDIAALLNQDRRELIVSIDKQVLLEYAIKLGLNDLRKELEEEEADEQTVEELCSLEDSEASHPGGSVDGVGEDHRADDDNHHETQVSSLSWRHKKFARSQKYFARKSKKAKSSESSLLRELSALSLVHNAEV